MLWVALIEDGDIVRVACKLSIVRDPVHGTVPIRKIILAAEVGLSGLTEDQGLLHIEEHAVPVAVDLLVG